ncbi:MAG: DegV family protein [Anaerolineales bacterium]
MTDQQRVAIVTDSTSDIPGSLARELNISVVPALLTIEGKSFPDGEGMTREEIYARMPTLTQPITTAVPSASQFSQAYRSLLEAGFSQVLSIHVSSKLSGMLNAAKQAADEYEGEVSLFDSRQISLGLGFQVIKAAQHAMGGASMDSLLERVREVRKRISVVAMINSLEYLHRSGRVSWLRAGLGDFLRIKLLVEVRDGLVEELAKTRTSGRALKQIKDLAQSWAPLEKLAVLHAGIPSQARQLADDLQNLLTENVLVVDVTTIIGAHVGPGSFGLAALRG